MMSSPKVRFKNFNDKWLTQILSEVVNVIDCKHRTPKYVEDGIPVVSPGTIKWGEVDLNSPTKRVTYEDYKSLMDHCTPKRGDLVFSRNQSIGIASLVMNEKEFVLGQDTVLMQAIGINSWFNYYILQGGYVQGQISKLSGGSTFSRINLGDIRKLKIRITPNENEQQKIASFLSAVDEKVRQLTLKKELLEQYKKGVMQQLFSGNLRFKGENGAPYSKWEEKSLGDIGSTFNGLTGKTKENFGEGKPYIQYMQIFANSKIDISKCGLVQIDKDEEQQKVKFGDVFFTTSSETPEEIGTCSVLLNKVDEMYLNSFCFGFRPNSFEQLVPNFAAYLFRNEIFRRLIIRLAQGSTRYNMSKVQLMRLRVPLPSKKEQQRIANFLTALDAKIESVAAQISHTQGFKKGLLQQMFV